MRIYPTIDDPEAGPAMALPFIWIDALAPLTGSNNYRSI
jgi:hypothetical protein